MEKMVRSILHPFAARRRKKSLVPYAAEGLPATYDEFAARNIQPDHDRDSRTPEKDRDDER